MLSFVCIVHKVEDLKLDCVVISFDFRKQRKWNPSQIYAAMTVVKQLKDCSLLNSTITVHLLALKRYLTNTKG